MRKISAQRSNEFRWGFGFLILMANAPAFADPTSGNNLSKSDSSFSYSDFKSKDCGQACQYKQANENLTLQYLYIKKKLDFLDSQIDSSGLTNDAQWTDYYERKARLESQKREVLGVFCRQEQSEELQECINRYKVTTDLWIAKLRGSLAQNEQSQKDLVSTDPKFQAMTKTAEPGETTPGRMPHLPTASELGQMSSSVDPKNFKADQNLAQNEPRPEDFIAFDRIPRDPNDSSKGDFIVPKMSGGKLVKDDKAYQAALTLWRGWVKPGLTDKFGEKEVKIDKQIEADQASFKQQFAAGVTGENRSVLRKIYDDARGNYVRYINAGGVTAQDRISNSFSPTQNFSGSGNPAQGGVDRSTAGVGANPGVNNGAQPSSEYIPGKYTGSEAVNPASDHEDRSVRTTAEQVRFEVPALHGDRQPGHSGQNPQGIQTTQSPQDSQNRAPIPPNPSSPSVPNPYSGSSNTLDQFLNPP